MKKKNKVFGKAHGTIVYDPLDPMMLLGGYYGMVVDYSDVKKALDALKRDLDRRDVVPECGASDSCFSGMVPPPGKRGGNMATMIADSFHIPVLAPFGFAHWKVVTGAMNGEVVFDYPLTVRPNKTPNDPVLLP